MLIIIHRSGLKMEDISAIAATVGPGRVHQGGISHLGLATCLRIGLTKAKELAIEHKKPFIPINHLEAHAMVSRLQNYVDNKVSDYIL